MPRIFKCCSVRSHLQLCLSSRDLSVLDQGLFPTQCNTTMVSAFWLQLCYLPVIFFSICYIEYFTGLYANTLCLIGGVVGTFGCVYWISGWKYGFGPRMLRFLIPVKDRTGYLIKIIQRVPFALLFAYQIVIIKILRQNPVLRYVRCCITWGITDHVFQLYEKQWLGL